MKKTFFALISLIVLLSCQQKSQTDQDATISAIYGGQIDSSEKFNAIVAIGKKHCTGTLISPTIVVTAAHCIASEEFSKHRITNIEEKVILANDYNKLFIRKYSIDYGVVHPLYNFNNTSYDHYDIAFLKLKRKVRGVNFIEMATHDEIEKLVGHAITFVGFGMNDIENADGKKLSVKSKINRLGRTELFAGGHGSSICFGDSGGPMLAKIDGKLKLVGVTSRNYSSFIGTPAKACKDESIFTKAYLAQLLIQSEELIDSYLETNNSNLLIESDQKYSDESWASFYLANRSKTYAQKLITRMPWATVDILTPEENVLYSATAHLKRGNIQKSLELFAHLKDLNDQTKSYYSEALKRNGKYQQALELISESDNIDDLELKLEIALARNRFNEAQALYPQIKLNKDNYALHIYYQILNNNEQAAINLVKAAPQYSLNRLFASYGNTLQIALAWNQLDLASKLIDHGIDVNARSNSGSALNQIAAKNNTHLLNKIISAGANIDAPDRQYGNTALMIAAAAGDLDIVKILIENGANAKHQGAYGVTALSQAQQKGHQEIIDYLESLP